MQKGFGVITNDFQKEQKILREEFRKSGDEDSWITPFADESHEDYIFISSDKPNKKVINITIYGTGLALRVLKFIYQFKSRLQSRRVNIAVRGEPNPVYFFDITYDFVMELAKLTGYLDIFSLKLENCVFARDAGNIFELIAMSRNCSYLCLVDVDQLSASCFWQILSRKWQGLVLLEYTLSSIIYTTAEYEDFARAISKLNYVTIDMVGTHNPIRKAFWKTMIDEFRSKLNRIEEDVFNAIMSKPSQEAIDFVTKQLDYRIYVHRDLDYEYPLHKISMDYLDVFVDWVYRVLKRAHDAGHVFEEGLGEFYDKMKPSTDLRPDAMELKKFRFLPINGGHVTQPGPDLLDDTWRQ